MFPRPSAKTGKFPMRQTRALSPAFQPKLLKASFQLLAFSYHCFVQPAVASFSMKKLKAES